MSDVLTREELRKLVGGVDRGRARRASGPVRVKPGLVLFARLASADDLLLDGWVRPANSIKEATSAPARSAVRLSRREEPASSWWTSRRRSPSRS